MELEKESYQHFEHAIKKGDLDLVKKLLDEGKSLHSWNAKHWTPLFNAVAKKNGELVRLFLENGADVNLPNRSNLGTPLHCASEIGRCDFVKLLLESGAEVNTLSGLTKSSPLFVASGKGHCDIVEVLLANKSEVNLPNEHNEIPLDIACQAGHLEVVKVLLDNGADVNWRGRWEGTPLIYACEGDYYDIVAVLLDRGANINPVGICRHLHTPLYHASLNGYTKVVKLLLQKGAAINWPSVNGDTPLHAACYRGHYILAELLLGLGAEVNRSSIDGKSPLYLACAAGHSLIVKTLLEKGAEVDQDIDSAWDLSWHTPLYMALREGHREMISMLLNVDIDMYSPYDKDHPMGKTISEARTLFYYSKILKSNTEYLNVLGKCYANTLILEHLTKLRIAGLANTGVTTEAEVLCKCVLELDRINSFKIFKNVSLGAVFQKAKCPLYLRNEELLKRIEDYLYSEVALNEFPIYVYILRNKLQKSKRMLSLLTNTTKVLQEFLPEFPGLVVENILCYLNEEDLKNISSLKESSKNNQ